MSTENPALARRSDLDALRAGAMLLGIVLHASLSFFPSYWMVTDARQNEMFGIVFSAIHGFRMPLFFVMSGYFSAMLLHRRGRGALIKHRFHRVFVPLMVGLGTIVPLTLGISTLAVTSAPRKVGGTAPAASASTIWAAARAGDLDAMERHLKSGVAVDAIDPDRGGTPMMWAATAGRAEAVQRLIDRGADVNAAGGDGGTALHGAAFLGHEKTVEVLIRNGANLNVANKDGTTPLDTAVLDEGTTRYFASVLQLELDENGLGRRKAAIAEALRHRGATAGRKSGLVEILMQMPLFNHLWFLWFLWWLVVGYAAVAAIGSRLPSLRLPSWLVLSPARYLWLIPLTMIPQWFMGNGGSTPIFGPDTSTGPLPIPHVFAYYAIFFGFGTLDFQFDDGSARIGRRWWQPLTIGLLVILPLALALLGPASFTISPLSRRVVSVFMQAAYPWCITFGLMGLFRRYFPAENATMRYLSDSAYWLYLAHLPLIIAAQLAVKDWPIPALAKFLLIVTVVTAFLLWTYQTLVRYTWLGRFLNGPRARPREWVRPQSSREAVPRRCRDGERQGFDRITPVSCRLRRHLGSSVVMRSEPGVGQEFAKPIGGWLEQAEAAANARRENSAIGVRELLGPDWYHQDSGPVYSGRAFVGFRVRTRGGTRFRRSYVECQPDTFAAKCREIFETDLDDLEAEFWGDVQKGLTANRDNEGGTENALMILNALGRPGWRATQAPRRSVLAQLTHTAPRFKASLFDGTPSGR